MCQQVLTVQIVNNLDKNRSSLDSPSFRESLYRCLHPQASLPHLSLMRVLFEIECDYRSDENAQERDDYEYFENIYWCALFLYQIGRVADVLPMWRAKNIDMDTGCGFDAQFMVGAGPEETCKFLENSDDPDAEDALEYIQANVNSGAFAHLADWYDGRIRYYTTV